MNLDLREPGRAHNVTQALWGSWAEAAAVTLERFHASTPQACRITNEGEEVRALVHWQPADDRTRRSHANTTDATEAGAYAVATLAVHAVGGWRVIGRTTTASGADVWMQRDGDHPEAMVRLEVSGIAKGEGSEGLSALRTRLAQKVRQLAAGESDAPGIAVVVGFELLRVCMSPRG